MPVSFEEVIYPLLIAEENLGRFVADHRFHDIGTTERLEKFEHYISKNEVEREKV